MTEKIDTSEWDDLIKELPKTPVVKPKPIKKVKQFEDGVDAELEKIGNARKNEEQPEGIQNLRFAKCCFSCRFRKWVDAKTVFCMLKFPDYKAPGAKDGVNYFDIEFRKKHCIESGLEESHPFLVCDKWTPGEERGIQRVRKAMGLLDVPLPGKDD